MKKQQNTKISEYDEHNIISNSRSSITNKNNTVASGTVVMETTIRNTVGIRPLSVWMETAVRIETPVRMEMTMQMFKMFNK